MKKFLIALFLQFVFFTNTFADLSEKIKPTKGSDSLNPTSWDIWLASIFKWFRWELTTIVFIIAVAVFVFIGIRMATARGNPEEFKKAWVHFVYAVIGIFVVFLAYYLVKLISSLASNF